MSAHAVLILLTAAGSSRRMGPGRDKLLEEVGGKPLLRERAETALATRCPLLVTLPPDRPERHLALAGLAARITVPEGLAEGMSASLRAGAAEAAARGLALMVLPADMPDLSLSDLRCLLEAWSAAPEAIHRGASESGAPGHPVIFPPDLLAEVATLSGDQGAKPVLQAHKDRIRLHRLPGDHALTDLDTPEAWEAWRSRPATHA